MRPSSTPSLARLEPELGAAAGRARARSTAASPTATSACGSAARTSSCACPGKDTELLGIDRARRARGHASRPPPRASAPAVVAFLRERAVPRHALHARAAPLAAERLRAPGADRSTRSPRAARAATTRAGAAGALRRLPELLDDYARDRRGAAARLPAGYDAARRCGERIARGAAGSEHVPVPVPQRPADRATSSRDGDARCCIVDWEYAGMGDRYFDLGNLSVNNGFAEATTSALLRGLLRRAGDRRGGFAALRLMRVHVGRPRGDVGRRAGRASRSSTSTSPATRASTSRGCGAAAGRPALRGAGWRWSATA